MKEASPPSKTYQARRADPLKDFPIQYTLQQRSKMLQLASQNSNFFMRWTHNDLNALAEVSRFFSFSKSTLLARKEQPVDYLGLVISGTAVAVYDDRAITQLDAYQMIGYMATMGLPGTHYHFFDVIGETDGVVLTVRFEELKDIQSKHPEMTAKLFDLAAVKCVEVVKHQYFADASGNQMKTSTSSLSDKRIAELFEFSNNPLIKEFWSSLENKERNVLGKSVKFVQMNPRDVIIQKDYAHSMLLMVLKGECIGLDDNVNAMNRNVVLGQGTVYGVSNFLEERPFQHNVYCRQKGICMIVTKTMFSRVMKDKSNLALQFYRFLVKQQTSAIKSKSQSIEKVEDFFIETNLKKKRKKAQQAQSLSKSSNFDQFAKRYDIIPLHNNEFFKDTILNLLRAQDSKMKLFNKLEAQHNAKNPDMKKIKTENSNKDTKVSSPMSTLFQIPNPKVLSQFQSFFADKRAELLGNRKNVSKPRQHNIVLKVNLQRNLTEQDDQATTKRVGVLQQENSDLKKQIQTLKQSIAQSNALIKGQTDKVIEANTKLIKMEVHKELLRRSEALAGATVGANKVSNSVSLMDVFAQQLKQNQRHRLVAKCAYKWLYQTRKRLRMRGKAPNNNILIVS